MSDIAMSRSLLLMSVILYSFPRRVPLNVAESVAGDFGVTIGIIPTQNTEPASRFRGLVIVSGVHDHIIGRCWATALVDQKDDVRLIEDELAAHHDFFCCAHTCRSSFYDRIVKEHTSRPS